MCGFYDSFSRKVRVKVEPVLMLYGRVLKLILLSPPPAWFGRGVVVGRIYVFPTQRRDVQSYSPDNMRFPPPKNCNSYYPAPPTR